MNFSYGNKYFYFIIFISVRLFLDNYNNEMLFFFIVFILSEIFHFFIHTYHLLTSTTMMCRYQCRMMIYMYSVDGSCDVSASRWESLSFRTCRAAPRRLVQEYIYIIPCIGTTRG